MNINEMMQMQPNMSHGGQQDININLPSTDSGDISSPHINGMYEQIQNLSLDAGSNYNGAQVDQQSIHSYYSNRSQRIATSQPVHSNINPSIHSNPNPNPSIHSNVSMHSHQNNPDGYPTNYVGSNSNSVSSSAHQTPIWDESNAYIVPQE